MAETTKPTRDFYKILIVSPPGKGKTFSFRNMDPDTFGLINIENKPLPFKNTLKHHVRPTSRVEAFNALVDMAKNPEIKAIGIDSFSAYLDIVLAEARQTQKGLEGSMEKRAKVKGKEWEGIVEKEFTIVLFGDNKFLENGKPEYFFKLVEEGTSAKCPPDIFGEGVYKIPNDVKLIVDKIHEFVK